MQQHSILIVDDSLTNTVVLEAMLGDTYRIETVGSGEDALELAPRFRPDLILLDIIMPGIDGYETCRRLRTMAALRYTKIMMVSAKKSVEERLKGYEVGADDYLIKPFDEEELLAKVGVYLRLKSVEEVDQLKSDLLSLLSHETRTPLNGILAPIDMLADDDMSLEERDMLFDMVRQSAHRLKTFFEKVDTLSQMKAGRWRFRFMCDDLGQIVHRAVCQVTELAAEHHITIESQLPPIANTMLDLERMQHVVLALLQNAVQFSPDGGRVVVRVSHDEGRLCLAVTDYGDGIDHDVLPYVFEEFAVADIMHHSTGHGLSLAIAQQVVHAHHGTIEVESEPHTGTTFTVTLPITSVTP